MKVIASLVLSGWATLVPAAWSQSAEADPFEEDERLRRIEEARRLTVIRVQVEFIEVKHETMTELMSAEVVPSDNALRKQLGELVKKKEARMVETLMAVARPGQKASTESVEEYIYPTEYEPPEIPNEVQVVKGDGETSTDVRDFATGPTPTAFETRNLGSTLEIEPSLSDESDIIELKFAPELVYHVKNEVWAEWNGKHGEAHIQMPVMYSMRVSGLATVRSGNYRLVAAVSPKGPDGHPAYERKVMIFVRPDLVTSE